MACWVDDCDGCGCAALAGRGGMPPCGHCEGHGIDLEPCALCGCDLCGCTPERDEIRSNAAAYPELLP